MKNHSGIGKAYEILENYCNVLSKSNQNVCAQPFVDIIFALANAKRAADAIQLVEKAVSLKIPLVELLNAAVPAYAVQLGVEGVRKFVARVNGDSNTKIMPSLLAC